MDVNENTFKYAAVKLYDILKAKNALVKSTYYVTKYAVCNFVPFIREKKSSVYPTARVKSVVKAVRFSHKR